MIEDMTMRKLSSRTQTAYIRAVKNLTCFLGQSPDAAKEPARLERPTDHTPVVAEFSL